jgi:serine protease
VAWRIVNLSLGGTSTSRVERAAVACAVGARGAGRCLGGNERRRGNPVEYPAALLQPPRSNGIGGVGLAVAASTSSGRSADFSNTGSWVSLAAPGEGVFGAVSPLSSPVFFPRAAVPWSGAGLYGFASGSSFAAPEVAGAAALVWAANPALGAQQVAQLLKATASGHGAWTRDLGFGVIDVAAAVAAATSMQLP